MRDDRAGPVGRLTKRADFLAAASGRRFHTGRMTVQGRLRPAEGSRPADGQGLRVGFTVTKKVGHATERNRIKRRLRTAVQSAAAGYRDRSLDVVVIGRRDILTADYRLLIDDLRRALQAVAKPKSERASEPPPPTDGERRGTSHA